ncbi:Leucine-rich repeat-containing protein 39 [Intoshia linei]|uniref:Leucine-rich repeat-containing protein 39 n=1 Tax=Intoshia linei TaxID=1819745 RepID=A0A177B4J8_9BILA|nr:Leucine-rich repeat-containing protein 39 [Intoshia linei]
MIQIVNIKTEQDNQDENIKKNIVYNNKGLTNVPMAILSKTQMTHLDLSFNNIRSLPENMGNLENLRHLNLQKNALKCTHPNDNTCMPETLMKLKKLEYLSLRECNLIHIPQVCFELTSLKTLNLSRNKLTIIPTRIGNFDNLKELNLEETGIDTLPAELAFCQDLSILKLWGNKMTSLPDTLVELKRLKILKINYLSFCTSVDEYMDTLLKNGKIQSEHLPPVIFDLPSIQELDLTKTHINNLPETQFLNLSRLVLSENYFNIIPDSIYMIETLETLNMCKNVIECIDNDIVHLKNLVNLHLDHNRIRLIPTKMCNMLKLKYINLGFNKIENLPENIGNLKRLEFFSIESNKVVHLPTSLYECTNLSTLNLCDNDITFLDLNLENLVNLDRVHEYARFKKIGLWLHKNPLETPPPNIWKSDKIEPILQHLTDLSVKSFESLNRVKLIFFGSPHCGVSNTISNLIKSKCSLSVPIKKINQAKPNRNLIKENTPNSTSINTESIINYNATNNFIAYLRRTTECFIKQCLWTTPRKIKTIIYNLSSEDIFSYPQFMYFNEKSVYLIIFDTHDYMSHIREEKMNSESIFNHFIGNHIRKIRMMTESSTIVLVGTKIDIINEIIKKKDLVPKKSIINKNFKTHQSLIRKVAHASWFCKDGSNPNKSKKKIKDARLSINLFLDSDKMTEIQKTLEKLNFEINFHLDNFKIENDTTKTLNDPKFDQYQSLINYCNIGENTRLVQNVYFVSNSNDVNSIKSLIFNLEMICIDLHKFVKSTDKVSYEVNPTLHNFITSTIKNLQDTYMYRQDFVQLIFDSYLKVNKEPNVTNSNALYTKLIERSIQMLHNSSVIIASQQPLLDKYIFFKPHILRLIVRSVYRDDIETFLDYDDNLIFKFISNMSRESFVKERFNLLNYGQYSRRLYLCSIFAADINFTHIQKYQNDANINLVIDILADLRLIYKVTPNQENQNNKSAHDPIFIVPAQCKCFAPNEMVSQVLSNIKKRHFENYIVVKLVKWHNNDDIKDLKNTINLKKIYITIKLEKGCGKIINHIFYYLVCALNDECIERLDYSNICLLNIQNIEESLLYTEEANLFYNTVIYHNTKNENNYIEIYSLGKLNYYNVIKYHLSIISRIWKDAYIQICKD